jgi:hypothetical protein
MVRPTGTMQSPGIDQDGPNLMPANFYLELVISRQTEELISGDAGQDADDQR